MKMFLHRLFTLFLLPAIAAGDPAIARAAACPSFSSVGCIRDSRLFQTEAINVISVLNPLSGRRRLGRHLLLEPLLESSGVNAHESTRPVPDAVIKIHRVVFAGFGSWGDLAPLVETAREFQRLNPEIAVVFLGNPNFENRITGAGLTFVPIQEKSDYLRQLHNPKLFAKGTAGISSGLRSIAPAIETVYRWIADHTIPSETVLFSNLFVNGAVVAAEKLNIPLVIGDVGASWLWSVQRPPRLPNLGFLSSVSPFFRSLIYDLMEGLLLDAILGPPLNALRRRLGLHRPVSGILTDYLRVARLRIGHWSAWFAERQDDWPPIEPVGFPAYDQSGTFSPELRAFLDDGPPPIVFTGGSSNIFVDTFFRAAREAVRQGRFRAVFIGPDSQMPADLRDNPNVYQTSDWVPFGPLFARAAAVVHPAAIGTGTLAMRAGIPQLLFPLSYDQPDNAERFQRQGVARVLPESAYREGLIERAVSSISRRFQIFAPIAGRYIRRQDRRRGGEIAAGLQALLSDDGVKTNCAALRQRLAEEPDGGLVAAQRLKTFIDQLETESGHPAPTENPHQGKVVFITGASSGIGKALAFEFASRGFSVALTARREEPRAALERELIAAGYSALTLICDVTVPAQIHRAVNLAVEHFGGLDIVIANAGIDIPGRKETVTAEQTARLLAVNYHGAIDTVHAALPFVAEREGILVFTGSLLGFARHWRHHLYTESKHLLRGYAGLLSEKLRGLGIAIVYLAPGYLRSQLRTRTHDGHHDPRMKDPIPESWMMDVEKAARKMADDILARKAEVVLSTDGHLLKWLSTHARWTVTPIMAVVIFMIDLEAKWRNRGDRALQSAT